MEIAPIYLWDIALTMETPTKIIGVPRNRIFRKINQPAMGVPPWRHGNPIVNVPPATCRASTSSQFTAPSNTRRCCSLWVTYRKSIQEKPTWDPTGNQWKKRGKNEGNHWVIWCGQSKKIQKHCVLCVCFSDLMNKIIDGEV
jgi:hypothetical protein